MESQQRTSNETPHQQRKSVEIKLLEDCNLKLSSTVASLKKSVDTLKGITADAERLRRVTDYTKKCEIVTEDELVAAHTDLVRKIRPEADMLIRQIRGYLTALAKEEDDLQQKVNVITDQVTRLRQNQSDDSPQPNTVTADAQRHEALREELRILEERMERSRRRHTALKREASALATQQQVPAPAARAPASELPPMTEEEKHAFKQLKLLSRTLLPGSAIEQALEHVELPENGS